MSKQQRGHRPLNLRERELISRIESCSEDCADLCSQLGKAALHDGAAPVDLRWLRIGEDHLRLNPCPNEAGIKTESAALECFAATRP